MSAPLGHPFPLRHPPTRTWILRSKMRARIFAALAGLGIAAGTSIACWFFYQAGEPPLVMIIAADIFAGVLACLLIAGVLGNIVDRADALRLQLETVAQVNHHVRNALQLISFSAYSTHDQETITKIREGTERIEWALREILEPGSTKAAESQPPPENKKPAQSEPAPGEKRPPGTISA